MKADLCPRTFSSLGARSIMEGMYVVGSKYHIRVRVHISGWSLASHSL